MVLDDPRPEYTANVDGFQRCRSEIVRTHRSYSQAREKLRKLVQVKTVPKYLSDSYKIYLTTPDMYKGENLEKSCSGIKYKVTVEVLKAGTASFGEGEQINMHIDSEIWDATHGDHASSSSAVHPTPMEIGNVEARIRWVLNVLRTIEITTASNVKRSITARGSTEKTRAETQEE